MRQGPGYRAGGGTEMTTNSSSRDCPWYPHRSPRMMQSRDNEIICRATGEPHEWITAHDGVTYCGWCGVGWDDVYGDDIREN